MPDAALPLKSGRIPKSRESNKIKKYFNLRDQEYLFINHEVGVHRVACCGGDAGTL